AENVTQEISKTANRGKFDLLVVGSSRPLLSQDETGGKARYFFDKVKCNVGLLIDKGFEEIRSVLIIMESEDDNFMQMLARGFNPQCHVDYTCLLSNNSSDKSAVNTEIRHIRFPETDDNLRNYDLIIATIDCYRNQREVNASWVDGNASLLLISRSQ
ncbi:MAG TPA: hypothetical protein PLM34_06600, partial [Lentimicrobium sp.]|nr:hypothetical protein [Lentimicrobium sp.]